MSGAVRAAMAVDTVVDIGRETDFPVLTTGTSTGPSRNVRPSTAIPVTRSATSAAVVAARPSLSGSVDTVDTGVC
jgi:hypothetical protein